MPPIVLEKLSFSKDWAESALIIAIIVLTGVGAFGLGRLSALEERRGSVAIHSPGDATALAAPVPALPDGKPPASAPATSGNYVASKNGTKYYLSTCAGAKNISEASKVYFASAEEAAAAGYAPAANCKGL